MANDPPSSEFRQWMANDPPSSEFRQWLDENRAEFQAHMDFAMQAFTTMRREPPSPQYEILAASIIGAMRVREYKRDA